MKQAYLYGIVDSSVENIISLGVTNHKPYCIPFNDISVIASTYNGEAIEPNIDCLSKHHEVINEIMAKHCILPASFKTIFNDKTDIYTFVSKNYDLIKSNLEKLLNKCEIGIKIIWDINKVKQEIINENEQNSSGFNPNTPAKIYLKERLSVHSFRIKLEKKAETIKEYIIEELSNMVFNHKIKLLETEKMAVNAAFLIDMAQKDQFISKVEKIKQANKDLSFLISGPWAPYNFVELNG